MNYTFNNIKRLSNIEYNMDVSDRVATNSAYGHMYQFKKYAGISESSFIKCTVEHGAVLGVNSFWKEIITNVPTILTASNERAKILSSKYGKTAIVIGPYIAYADSYLSKNVINEIKKTNGRTLLVLPSHSVADSEVKYDEKAFEDEIVTVSHDFDKVVICLHFSDVRFGKGKKYEEKGYEVVCAGTDSDKDFLPRLKSILMLSDGVMANGISTGLIYAIYMRKPVYYYEQSLSHANINRQYYSLGLIEEPYRVFKSITNSRKMDLIEEQIEWCFKYAGGDETKTPKQLNSLLTPLIRNN